MTLSLVSAARHVGACTPIPYLLQPMLFQRLLEPLDPA